MAKPTQYKTFAGKRYTLANWPPPARAKSIANKFAKVARSKGKSARVVQYSNEGKKYYALYVRTK